MPTESRKRVLIADDDADVRSIVGSVLRERGLDVTIANDGEAAIGAMREQRFAVIVLDLLMPGTDGFGVLDHIAKLAWTPLPVVLVLTGAEQPVVDRLDPQRIHGIVRKPFEPEELASLVVACAEVRNRSGFDTMALAAMLAGSPLIVWLSR